METLNKLFKSESGNIEQIISASSGHILCENPANIWNVNSFSELKQEMCCIPCENRLKRDIWIGDMLFFLYSQSVNDSFSFSQLEVHLVVHSYIDSTKWTIFLSNHGHCTNQIKVIVFMEFLKKQISTVQNCSVPKCK